MNIENVVEKLTERLGENVTVGHVVNMKLNGVKVPQFNIRRKEDQIGALIPYDSTLADDEIVDNVIEVYKTADKNTLGIDIAGMTAESIYDNVIPVIVNTEKNKEMLESVIHEELCDGLSVIYRVDIEGGLATITNNLIEIKNLDENTIKTSAIQNAAKDFSMKEFLSMPIISNGRGFYGAGLIVSKTVLEKACDSLNVSKFYIIPSSVHEVICVPDNSEIDANFLRDTIRAVNETQVGPEDFLSNDLFMYDSEVGKVEVVR